MFLTSNHICPNRVKKKKKFRSFPVVKVWGFFHMKKDTTKKENYWFNFLNECTSWFYCIVKFLMFFICSYLFFIFTSPYNIFVFQLTVTNWHLIFFFFTISLSPLATYCFPKFDDNFIALNMYCSFFFFFHLILLPLS